MNVSPVRFVDAPIDFIGYTPFAASTSDDTWNNVYNYKKRLIRPVYEGVDQEFNMSDCVWDLISRLIVDRFVRIKSIEAAQAHPFFGDTLDFNVLRTSKSPKPPFRPKLASMTDVKYFDDFESVNDMEIYQEVKERHEELERKETILKENDYRCDFVGFQYNYASC